MALVRNGTSLVLYLNGTSVGSATNSTNFNNASSLGIGATAIAPSGGSVGSFPITGYLSNVRFVKGTAVYTSAFTPSTTPLTAISGTSLLTCQSNRFVDNSSNAFAITVNGNTSVQAFSPFAPTAAYSAATVGGSGYFDGSGDWLGIGTSSNNITLSGDFCMEAWVYRNANTDSTIFGNYQASPNRGWSLRTYTSNNLYIYFQVDGGSEIIYTTASGSAPIGAWNHVVWCRSGTNASVYVNGSRVDNRTLSGTSTGSGGLAVGALSINRTDINPNGYFSGARLVNGSAVYDPSQTTITVPTAPPTAVTNTQLLLNFTNGGIIDNTAKNVLETVGNAQISTSVKKFGTGSISFNRSTASYLAIPQPLNFTFGTGDFTIEFWLYLNQLPPTADGYGLFGTRPLFTNGAYLTLGMSQAGAFGFTTNGADVCISGNVAQASVWQHMAYTRSGSTVRIFRNGTQIATGTDSTNLGVGSGRAIVGSLDANPIVNYSIDGYIDDLRITKGIARYTANFTPQTSQWQDQ
jgi:hypothetical protein